MMGVDGKTSDAEKTGLVDSVRLAIPLGIAVVAGVLVVLGLNGDPLSRFIRAHPHQLFAVMALAIVGVVLPAAWKVITTPREKKDGERRAVSILKMLFRAETVGAALVVTSAVLLTHWGTGAIAEREQPDLAVTATAASTQPDFVNIGVKGKGTSLRSRDKMLIRIMAIKATVPSSVESTCGNPRKPGRNSAGAIEGETTRTIFWGESASNTTGSVSADVRVQVSRKEYQWICVYSALSKIEFEKPADEVSKENARSAMVIIDLNHAPSVPAGA